jgi:hypothetical protein
VTVGAAVLAAMFGGFVWWPPLVGFVVAIGLAAAIVAAIRVTFETP